MKYLKLFKTDAEYQQFIGGDFLKPNVSLVNDTKSLFYYPLAQEEPELPYLTITALEDDLTVSFSNPCQYSLNGTDWNELQADEQTPAISSGEKIYFKGELKPTFSGIGIFTVSKPFNLSGTVMSMLFGDEAEGKTDLTGYDSAFSSLFSNTLVVNVSSDFLPATTLANSCYKKMFKGCTSLVNAPELPATTLANMCYDGMFQDCTSLVNAPELPAAQLANYCYQQMFKGCTSLVNAPELPATTLAENCYRNMFQSCTSLVNAPELPAAQLANYCYQQMFSNCTSLSYIKAMFTTEPSSSYTNNWVFNVSPTGTFVKSKDATWNITGYIGIPGGWTVETV